MPLQGGTAFSTKVIEPIKTFAHTQTPPQIHDLWLKKKKKNTKEVYLFLLLFDQKSKIHSSEGVSEALMVLECLRGLHFY